MSKLTCEDIVLLLIDANPGVGMKALDRKFEEACAVAEVEPRWTERLMGGYDPLGVSSGHALGFIERHIVSCGGSPYRTEYRLSKDGQTVVSDIRERFPRASQRVAGVAKARHLIERLACIPKPAGRRYVMVRVEPVPEFRGRVNERAIATLNENARGARGDQ